MRLVIFGSLAGYVNNGMFFLPFAGEHSTLERIQRGRKVKNGARRDP